MRTLRSVLPMACALTLTVLVCSPAAHALNFNVTNTADMGAGSLRQALQDANGNMGTDSISFNVSGAGCTPAGVCTITPLSIFPFITGPVTIDGYTQPGSSPNTNAQGAINAVLKIVISGVSIPGAEALHFEAGATGSTVRGLVVNGGFTNAIRIVAPNITVRGCFFGTDATGMAASTNSRDVYAQGFSGASATIVGGPQAADRNLLAGGGGQNVGFEAVDNGLIEGNLFGTNATGAAPLGSLPNLAIAVAPITAGTIIRRNVITGGTLGGILLGNQTVAPTILVQGNFIGTDVTGTVDFGNPRSGIFLRTTDAVIGGIGPGEGNVIAFNRGAGVYLEFVPGNFPQRNTIRGNSIYSNHHNSNLGSECLGIDFGQALPSCDPTPNDLGDADTGANGLQNFPVLTSAISGGGNTTITGLLNSMASTIYTLDFYGTACAGRPQAFREGKTYLGSVDVTTNGSGNAPINAVFPVTLGAGEAVTATATDPNGNTSEFSQRIVLSMTPISGPSAGGTPVTLNGFHFLPGATVDFSGSDAPGEIVANYNQITAVSPSRPPGTVSNVTVVNTDGTMGTLPSGWVSDFLDMTPATFGYNFVTKLVANLVTAGCGGGNFCGGGPVTREQMAVFLLVSRRGVCYQPPPATGTVFDDVPASSPYARWIEALAAAGVTGGCGGTSYCPGTPVTREQMAVFLLRMLEGPTYQAPACTVQMFGDVPCSSGFARWINELVARGITAGCGGGNYCPTQEVTRGQMAVFLVATYRL